MFYKSFLLLLLFALCSIGNTIDVNCTHIFIPKGIPFSFPLEYKFWVNQVSGSAYFTNETCYNLQNSHQHDWNKLTGISFTPWRTDTDALMVAWRYNVKYDYFEISPYFNVKTARILPLQNETIIIEKYNPFSFQIDYKGISINYFNQYIYKEKPIDLVTRYLTSFRVITWFGGSALPPCDIYLYLCI
jgi:hypothetical protein